MKPLTIARLAEMAGYNNPTTINNWKAGIKSKRVNGEIVHDDAVKDRYEMLFIGGLMFENGIRVKDIPKIIESYKSNDLLKTNIELLQKLEKMQDGLVELGAHVENLVGKR